MQEWRDIYFTARDGLRLYARHYPAPGSTRRPVLCLAGLSRNSRDFHRLAVALAAPDGGMGREVYTLDSRGRGLSEWDRDWRNYSVLVELNDALDFMTTRELHGAAVVGTMVVCVLAVIAILETVAQRKATDLSPPSPGRGRGPGGGGE